MESKIIVSMDDDTKDWKENQPCISSSDPNERKLARRLRIRKRLKNAEKQMLIAEKRYVEPEQEKTLIEETIETSEDTLRNLFLEGKELVTNIRVASDSIEVKRREINAQEKQNRIEQLREESALALVKLEEISNKWNAIVETTDPLELFQHMKEQKAKCLELIQEKNDLIKSFQLELKISDEMFMKGRSTMYDELALLTKRIDEQVLLMKRAYRIELEHIEESVDITRSQLIEKSMKSWQNLYNHREEDEVSNIHRKLKMVEKFHEELYELHRSHQEKYRETRINLESDIQVLEQELEQVKALCLLNSEKLDYNYQVLKKREEENVYIKNHQKRRLNKLQDMVNALKKKIEEKKQQTDEEVKKLIKEVERYHTNVLDTEKKANHISEVNEEKFQSIWDMKDEEAKDLIKKIVLVDKVIYEQILGLAWVSPPSVTLNKQELPSYKAAASVVKSLTRNERDKKPRKIVHKSYYESPELVAGSMRLMRHILELIANQSGFLMEEKLDELLKPYSDDEKTFVRLDNVFSAIDIHQEDDLEAMRSVFQPYAMCLICDKKKGSSLSIDPREDPFETEFKAPSEARQNSILQIRELEEKVSKLRIQAKREELDVARIDGSFDKDNTALDTTDSRREDTSRTAMSFNQKDQISEQRQSLVTSKDGQCDLSHPLVIEKYHVIKALKNFVSILHGDKCGVLTGMASRLSKKRYTISRILTKEDINVYWESFKTFLPAKIDTVWNAVLLALVRYKAILQDRHELNVKVNKVRRQNLELKRLLNHYRGRKGKSEIILPILSSVPDDPIEPEEFARIIEKISL